MATPKGKEGSRRPPETWRARLRFRVLNKLNVDATEQHLKVSGREVVLKPAKPDVKIVESEWLILSAGGFKTETEARGFGTALRTALELSAVACRVGVDSGQDLATSGLGRAVKDQILQSTGIDVRSNIHGLDVFPDHPSTRFLDFTAAASVLVDAVPILSGLSTFFDTDTDLSEPVSDVVLLLHYALMRPEPVAQIVFAVSAVESLGQDETWTQAQRSLLSELAEAAERSTIGTTAERQEVADAIRKSLHRLTLRQGVFRLLARLELDHLKRPWDELYAERSTLVHGLAPRAEANYHDLARRTVSLCGRILLNAVATEVPMIDREATKYYM